MTLLKTIQAHLRVLPPDLQREALEFIASLEKRHRVAEPTPSVRAPMSTEEFISRHAGSLGEDFPDDIDDSDLGIDAPRETI